MRIMLALMIAPGKHVVQYKSHSRTPIVVRARINDQLGQ